MFLYDLYSHYFKLKIEKYFRNGCLFVLISDIGFLTDFTRCMADAVKCPVSREIPECVRTKLDEYLLRKRRKEG